jgi:hypothetical protein
MANKFSEIEKLTEKLEELRHELEKGRKLYALSHGSILGDKVLLSLHHILNEIRDIFVLLQLINSYLVQLKLLSQKIFIESKSSKTTFNRSNPDDIEHFRKLDEYLFLSDIVPVLIKSSLQILDNIDNLINSNNEIKKLFSSTEPERKRLLIYRDKAVTHRNPLGTSGGIRIGKDFTKFEIMSSFIAPKELYNRIRFLFEKCKNYLPKEYQEEFNAHEQLAILYKCYNIIRDRSLEAEFKAVVRNFGLISPQPSEIADLSLAIMREIIKRNKD